MSETGVQGTVQNPGGRVFQSGLDTGIQKLGAGGEHNRAAVFNGFFNDLASLLGTASCKIKRGAYLSGQGIFQIMPSQLMTVSPAGL